MAKPKKKKTAKKTRAPKRKPPSKRAGRKNPTKYVVSKPRKGARGARGGQRVRTKDGAVRTIRARKNPAPAKPRRRAKSGFDDLRDTVAGILRRYQGRPGDQARATAAYFRLPLAARAAKIRALARSGPRGRRAAVAIARLERRHEEGPPKRKNPGMSDREAAAEYADKHWGERGRGRVRARRAPDPTHGTLAELGELTAVTYRTKKRGDTRPTDYEHEFEGKKPRLAYNDGGLVVVGGDYVIARGGITG